VNHIRSAVADLRQSPVTAKAFSAFPKTMMPRPFVRLMFPVQGGGGIRKVTTGVCDRRPLVGGERIAASRSWQYLS